MDMNTRKNPRSPKGLDETLEVCWVQRLTPILNSHLDFLGENASCTNTWMVLGPSFSKNLQHLELKLQLISPAVFTYQKSITKGWLQQNDVRSQ